MVDRMWEDQLGSNPARNPALLEWVTEAFSESTVTRWVSRKPAFQKPGGNPFDYCGFLGNHGNQRVSHSLF